VHPVAQEQYDPHMLLLCQPLRSDGWHIRAVWASDCFSAREAMKGGMNQQARTVGVMFSSCRLGAVRLYGRAAPNEASSCRLGWRALNGAGGRC